MKLKKLFAVMLVVALIAASFAACGGTEAPVEEPEDVVEVNVRPCPNPGWKNFVRPVENMEPLPDGRAV